MLPLRELRLRALMADNDFRAAVLNRAPDEEIKQLWFRKELYAARYRFERLRAEQGPKFRFYHEFRLWQRERRAA